MSINDEKFIELCIAYHEKICALFISRAFEVKGTSVILHFDGNGVLREIEKDKEKLWKREKLDKVHKASKVRKGY